MFRRVLSQLGFKVAIKSIADQTYFPTIGNLKLEAQTGYADWLQDFPFPGDFYLLLDKNGIQPVNNLNFSQVNDPTVQKAISKLDAIATSELSAHVSQWQALDYYVAQQAYELVYGYPVNPKFASNRVNYKALIVHPTVGWDWTSIKLK